MGSEISDEMAAFLHGAVGAVEANSFEHQSLWEEYHERLQWESETAGLMALVGKIAGNPIWISLRRAKINGHTVIFYYATSQVIDHRKVEIWLKHTIPDAWKNHSDAHNFFNVVYQLEELEPTP